MAERDNATRSLIAALLGKDKPEANGSSGDGIGEASTDDGDLDVALTRLQFLGGLPQVLQVCFPCKVTHDRYHHSHLSINSRSIGMSPKADAI